MTNVGFGIERVLSKMNEFEIEKRLKSLKESKSMGSDQIYPLIIKECPKKLVKPLKNSFESQLSKEKSLTRRGSQT